ncbi:MAG: hypothetical protein ACHQYP_04525 [Nitrospiria bacterium]
MTNGLPLAPQGSPTILNVCATPMNDGSAHGRDHLTTGVVVGPGGVLGLKVSGSNPSEINAPITGNLQGYLVPNL